MSATVSINLCCYNSEKYLIETLDSVINQIYTDWELVIINDGSTDSTEAIVKDYIDRGFPILYYSQKNHGLGYSRNVALEHSSGKYIAFLDHDDVWLPNKLEKQMAIFENNVNIDFIYTNYYIAKNRKLTIKYKKEQPKGSVFERFLSDYPVHVSTTVVRKSSIDNLHSLFNPDLNMTEDYDFFMRILYKGLAEYIGEPLATYRHHPDMSSVMQEIKLIKETIFVIETFSSLSPDFEKTYYEILVRLKKRSIVALSFKISKDTLLTGDKVVARSIIRPYKWYNIRTFVLFCITYFPRSLTKHLWPIFIKTKDLVEV